MFRQNCLIRNDIVRRFHERAGENWQECKLHRTVLFCIRRERWLRVMKERATLMCMART